MLMFEFLNNLLNRRQNSQNISNSDKDMPSLHSKQDQLNSLSENKIKQMLKEQFMVSSENICQAYQAHQIGEFEKVKYFISPCYHQKYLTQLCSIKKRKNQENFLFQNTSKSISNLSQEQSQRLSNDQIRSLIIEQHVDDIDPIKDNQKQIILQQGLKQMDVENQIKQINSSFINQLIQTQQSIQKQIFNTLNQYKLKNDSNKDMLLKNDLVEKILKNPEKYQIIINNTKQLKQIQKEEIIQSLKQNQKFIELCQKNKIKPIHNFALSLQSSENNGSNGTRLFYYQFGEIKWEARSIVSQIFGLEKKLIPLFLEKRNTKDFLKQFFHYARDCLRRKVDFKNIITQLKINFQNSQDKQISKIKENFEGATLNDMIFLMMKTTEDIQGLAIDLHKIKFPIPVYYEIPQSQSVEIIQQIKVLEFLFRIQEYNSVLLNIGFDKTKSLYKSRLISEVFYTPTQFVNSSRSYFQNGSIEVYSNLTKSKLNKQPMVIDFHSSIQKRNQKFVKCLNFLLNLSNIVLIHGTKQDFQDKMSQVNQWLSQNCIGLNSKKVIGIVHQNSFSIREFKPVYNEYIYIGLGKDTNDQNQQEIQKIRDEIFQRIDQSDIKISNKDLNRKKFDCSQIKIINMIKQLNNNQQLNFPHIFYQIKKIQLSKQKYKLQNSINYCKEEKMSNNNQIMKKIVKINTQLNQHEQKIKISTENSKVLSEFISLQKDQQLFNYLSYQVQKSSKQKSSPIESKYINMTAQYQKMKQKIKIAEEECNNQRKNQTLKKYKQKYKIQQTNNDQQDLTKLKQQVSQIQKAIEKINNQKEAYDISMSTFLQELIFKDSHQNKETHKNIILNRYRNAYKKKIPINLIYGRTLSYGNKYLQQFFDELSQIQQKQKKQVFIISVIGAQSSAKSTLMNYLFGCNFAAADGRCTKGVYFTIVQIQNKMMIVIDTEGLLSVCARDQAFDVQIASLIMKISDLVVINNKGQMSSVMRDLLNICMYVLENLYKEETITNEQKSPIKLFFVLRDQLQSSELTQQGMIANVINNLGKYQQKQSICYSNYFNFSSQNVFPLQNAFTQQNISNYIVKDNNYTFGKSNLMLRCKIVKQLKNPKHKSFRQFYLIAKITWEIIIKCGRQIFNYKTLLEIQYFQRIDKNCFRLRQQIIRGPQIISLTEKIQKADNPSQLKQHMVNQVRTIYDKQSEIFQQQAMNQCSLFCKNKQWILKKIQKYNKDFEIRKLNWLRIIDTKKKNLEQQQKKNILSKKIKLKIANIMKQKKQDKQVMNQFRQMREKLYQSTKQQTKRQISEYQSQNYSFTLKKFFWDLWVTKNDKIFQRQYQYIEQYLKKSKQKNYFLETLFQTNIVCVNSNKTITISNYEDLLNFWKKYLSQSELLIMKIYEDFNQQNLTEFQRNFNLIFNKIESIYKNFEEQICQYTNNWKITTLNLHKHVKDILFMNAILIINKAMASRFQKIRQEEEKNMGLQFKQLQENLTKSLQERYEYSKSGKQWFQIILKQIGADIIKEHRNKIQNQYMLNLRNELGQAKIIEQAFNNSLRDKHHNKIKWKKCWKLINNMNYYLKQLMYSSNNMTFLYLKAKQMSRQTTIMINNKLQIINRFLNQQNDRIKQNQQNQLDLFKYYTIQQYSQKLLNCNLTVFSNRDRQQLTKIIIQLNKIFNNNQRSNLIDKILNNLNFHEIRKQVEKMLQLCQQDVLGCQNLCPLCAVKCYKQKDHKEGCAVKQECHTLLCFGGVRYNISKQALKDMCFDEKRETVPYVSSKNQQVQQIYPNAVQFIKACYPRWKDHFQNDKVQSNLKREQYKQIWSNIKNMMLKYSFTEMKDNQVGIISQQLTQQDMNQEHKNDYYKKQQILDYICPGQSLKIVKKYKLKNYSNYL